MSSCFVYQKLLPWQLKLRGDINSRQIDIKLSDPCSGTVCANTISPTLEPYQRPALQAYQGTVKCTAPWYDHTSQMNPTLWVKRTWAQYSRHSVRTPLQTVAILSHIIQIRSWVKAPLCDIIYYKRLRIAIKAALTFNWKVCTAPSFNKRTSETVKVKLKLSGTLLNINISHLFLTLGARNSRTLWRLPHILLLSLDRESEP